MTKDSSNPTCVAWSIRDDFFLIGSIHSKRLLVDEIITEWKTAIEKEVTANPGKVLVLDFSEVEYASEAALRELWLIRQQVIRSDGPGVAIIAAQDSNVVEVLIMMGVKPFYVVRKDTETVIKELTPPPLDH